MTNAHGSLANAALDRLLDVKHIFYEPAVLTHRRGQEIFDRLPNVGRTEVASHWKILELHGNSEAVEDWLKNKREILVLGVHKTFPMRVNGRSGDFVASSVSSGCAMACAYKAALLPLQNRSPKLLQIASPRPIHTASRQLERQPYRKRTPEQPPRTRFWRYAVLLSIPLHTTVLPEDQA